MATHIKFLLEDFLKRKKSELDGFCKIERVVREALDDENKNHIFFKKILKDTLILGSDSSSFMYYFNLKKENVLKRVSKEFPEIKKIKIEIG